jgi:hypothetical protein
MPIRRVFSDTTNTTGISTSESGNGRTKGNEGPGACQGSAASPSTAGVVTIKRYRSSENEFFQASSSMSSSSSGSDIIDLLAKIPKAKKLSKEIGTDVCSYLQTQIEISIKLNADQAMLYAHLKDWDGLRRQTVDFICTAAEDFRLRKTTAHVAVNYLDRILSKAKVAENERILLALACIRLAAKFEESSSLLVPSLDSLIDFAQSRNRSHGEEFKTSELVRMEREVWTGLDNRLWVLTSAHFIDIFSTLGLLYLPMHGDRLMIETAQSDRSITRDLLTYCGFFDDLALQQVVLQGIESALLAGVIISCARRASNIVPVWSQCLQGVTKLLFQGEMENIHIYLWQIYAKTYRRDPIQMDENSLVSLSSTDSSISLSSTFSAESPLGPADQLEQQELHCKIGSGSLS